MKLTPELERLVKQCAKDERLSPDDALVKVIRAGVSRRAAIRKYDRAHTIHRVKRAPEPKPATPKRAAPVTGFDDEQTEDAKKLYGEGVSVRTLSKMFSVSEETIRAMVAQPIALLDDDDDGEEETEMVAEL